MTAVTDTTRSILVVDDDETFRARLVRAFSVRGFDACGAADRASAVALAREDSPEYAVVDLRLGEESGLEVVRALAALDTTTAIVVLTGYGSIATALESMRLGATNYLSKPADADQILQAFTTRAAGAAGPLPTDVPSLARVEWEHIQRVLTDCGGNVSQAARLLGLHRRSLQRKLAKYPVSR